MKANIWICTTQIRRPLGMEQKHCESKLQKTILGRHGSNHQADDIINIDYNIENCNIEELIVIEDDAKWADKSANDKSLMNPG